MGVRVRFAPSPTGLLHLGGARTALFNYLFATANRGQCILRIEDTDQDRCVPGSVEKLERSLQWLGIEFHESPSKGGLYGPYVQSKRLPLYQQYSRDLLRNGSGYPCFCSKERLQSLRLQRQNTGYDGLCRSLSRKQAEEKMSAGTPYTIRLKVPHDMVVKVNDMVYGEVEVSGSSIEDQVLLKTDGFPTYHLACVVDDHCMDISHVLRGEEWLLSTAKHLLLYSSLGWNPPVFAHLPLLLSSTGEKISKRQHSTSVQSYQEEGFLKEAVTEYLSQLHNGQSEYDDRSFERETLKELAHGFSLSRINRNPVTVDEEKLMWINKKHFLRRLQKPSLCVDLARELAVCVKTTLKVPPDSHTLTLEYLSQVLRVLKDRISLVPQIPVNATYFWRAPIPNRNTITSIDNAAIVLEAVRERLTQLRDFTERDLTSDLKGVSVTLNVSHKVTMQLCRAAVIGQQTSPGVACVFQVLGKDEVLDRLRKSITATSHHNT